MSLSRNDLATRVRRMLSDYALPAADTETADGITNVWLLTRHFVEPTTLQVFMTQTGTTTEVTGTSMYDFDPDTSAVTFTNAPGDGTQLDFVYRYTHWAEEDIVWALTDAVYDLAPAVYVQESLAIVGTGATEYAITDTDGEPPTRVVLVETSGDGESYEALPPSYWTVLRGELDAATLKFYSEVSDSIRVHYTKRAQPWSTGSATLADIKLPERMAKAITLAATHQLLEQRIIPRMRSDIAVVTQGEGVPTPGQLLQHSARIKALLDLELQRQRMRPQTAIGI